MTTKSSTVLRIKTNIILSNKKENPIKMMEKVKGKKKNILDLGKREVIFLKQGKKE